MSSTTTPIQDQDKPTTVPIEDNKFYMPLKRKLHDIWALVLYIIAVYIFIFLIVLLSKHPHKIKTIVVQQKAFNLEEIKIMEEFKIPSFITTISSNEFFLGDFLKLVIVPITLFSGILVLMCFFTEVVLHILFLLPPVACFLACWFNFFGTYIKNNINLVFIPSAIILLIVYFLIFSKIKYISKPLKMALGIMWATFRVFLSLMFIFTAIFLGVCYVYHTLTTRNLTNMELSIVGTYFFYLFIWTGCLILTVSQTVISSITAQHVVHDLTGTMLVKSSLRIVFYSLGSACFAALILAIVYIITEMVRDEINRKYNDSKNRGANVLLLMIQLLLILFREYLTFLTTWAMTIVALKGCKLTRALKSGLFKMRIGFILFIITFKATFILLLLLIMYLGAFLISGTKVVYLKKVEPGDKIHTVVNQYVLENQLGFESEILNKKNLFGVFNMIPIYYIVMTFVFLGSFCLFLQKILEMLYLIYEEEPNILKKKDMNVYGSMWGGKNSK
ncbi:Choline transporter-like protein 2 [Cucumispora dikerogammari]|nr:Choline transporter-like protein 2 [Cucumispora dikerogammari]